MLVWSPGRDQSLVRNVSFCTSPAALRCQRGRLEDAAGSTAMARAPGLLAGHRAFTSPLASLWLAKQLTAVTTTTLRTAGRTGRRTCEAEGARGTSAGLLLLSTCPSGACTGESWQSPNQT